MTNLCPLCGQRKARRPCPALGKNICSVCCGTKRQREIQCPPACVYLSSAREHPAAVVQRRHERDMRYFLPLIADLTEPQYRMMLLFQAILLKHAQGALPPVRDEDVADAAAAVAATLETARKGIIYEHQAASVPAQRLAAELSRTAGELARREGAPASVERDAAVALRRVERGARGAAAALAGDESPVFLTLMRRLMAGAAEAAGPEPPEGRVII